MTLEYIDTKKVCKAGKTCLVYLKKQWEFAKGDIIDLKVRKHNAEGEWFLGTRKVCRYGTGVGVFLDKSWGFSAGDMVEVHVSRRVSE